MLLAAGINQRITCVTIALISSNCSYVGSMIGEILDFALLKYKNFVYAFGRNSIMTSEKYVAQKYSIQNSQWQKIWSPPIRIHWYEVCAAWIYQDEIFVIFNSKSDIYSYSPIYDQYTRRIKIDSQQPKRSIFSYNDLLYISKHNLGDKLCQLDQYCDGEII